MADNASFFLDTREPFVSADITSVTLANTNKALYGVSNFPVLGGNYFARPGKAIRIKVFGRMTSAATPGNVQWGIYYGTGADANGVLLASTLSTVAWQASQTNMSWTGEFDITCRTTGSAGTLFATGLVVANVLAVLSTAQPILMPSTAPVVSGACDLTANLMLSLQALRSGSTAETMQIHQMQVIALN